MRYQATGSVEITEQTRQAVRTWVDLANLQPDNALFPSRIHAVKRVLGHRLALPGSRGRRRDWRLRRARSRRDSARRA